MRSEILLRFIESLPAALAFLRRSSVVGSFNALHTTFASADRVGELVVFNICGNKCHLIASIHFNRGKVYIRHVLTHQEYDRGGWKP